MLGSMRKRRAEPGPSNESKKRRADKSKVTCNVDNCFLLELSDPESYYVKNFNDIKKELAEILYSFYNNTIFEQQLPKEMDLKWNKRLRIPAGCCLLLTDEEDRDKRKAEIHISEKIIDSAERLRDTMIHEMCHAATWIFDGVDVFHGRCWRKYTKKALSVHPELPPITKYNTYKVHYPYTYECRKCHEKFGRFSKSINTRTKACTECEGKLFLRKN